MPVLIYTYICMHIYTYKIIACSIVYGYSHLQNSQIICAEFIPGLGKHRHRSTLLRYKEKKKKNPIEFCFSLYAPNWKEKVEQMVKGREKKDKKKESKSKKEESEKGRKEEKQVSYGLTC